MLTIVVDVSSESKHIVMYTNLENHTLQKLSSPKCYKGFSDIFDHFRRSCEALSVK